MERALICGIGFNARLLHARAARAHSTRAWTWRACRIGGVGARSLMRRALCAQTRSRTRAHARTRADLVLKCETDLWQGPVVGIGDQGLRLAMRGDMVRIPTYSLGALQGLEALPVQWCLVNNTGHWVPFWAASFEGPRAARPWLQEESMEGFAAPFRDLAARLRCECDVTVRAAGDCCFHGALAILDMLAAKGLEPEGDGGQLRCVRHIMHVVVFSSTCH